MNPVYITSVGEALPGPPIDNETLGTRLGLNPEWIEMFIGTRSRHFAVDLESGEAQSSLTDLCTAAAEQALARLGASPDCIDFMVLATATPDMLMPATVNLIADRLGCNQIPTYQVQSGCAGAVQAIDLARLLLQDGRHRTGLVVAGDVCRKHMLLDRDFAKLPPDQLVNYVLFGDGAGSVLMSTDPVPGALAVTMVLNRFTGLGREPGQTINWFGQADDPLTAQAFSEDYRAIEQSVPVMAAEIASEVLDECGWEPSELDWILPPQLSGRMTAEIVERLGLPNANEVSRVAQTGNNGNALPFLQLSELQDRIGPGERALVVAVESSKWIKGAIALEHAEAAA